jgi:hypothetical protein
VLQGALQAGELPFRGGLIQRLRLQFSVLFQQDFHLAFRFLQFLPAGGGELHSFFEETQRLLKRNIAFLELIYDFLQSLQTLFKFRHRSETPCVIVPPESRSNSEFFRLEKFRSRLAGSEFTMNSAQIQKSRADVIFLTAWKTGIL